MAQGAIQIFSLTRTQRYSIAIVGVAITTTLRLAIDPFLGDGDLPFLLSGYVIILAAWFGGLGPGLLATALTLLIGDYLFLAPRYSIFRYDTFSDFSRVTAVVFVGITFSMLFHRLRQATKAELDCLQRFRLLIESACDYAIFTLDPQGRVVCCSPGAEGIEGYKENEIVGRDFSIFYTSEDVESGKPWRELEIAAAEGRYEEEGWQIRKDGSRFWASGVIAPMRNGRGTLRGFAKVTRDLTERRLAEDALRESQRFAQHIVDVSPSVIYIYDMRQRKTIFVNRSIAATLGYDPGQSAQEADFVRSVTHPDDWQPFLNHLGRLADLRDDETAEFEYRMRHASGEWLWLQSRDKVFSRNEDGSVREIMGTTTDITERKNVEEKARFMSDLHQALLPLADPEEIMAVTARILGEHLNVDRCAYGEVEADGEHFIITHDYTRGETGSIAGRYRMSDIGEEERKILRENRMYVVNDIEAEAPAGTDLTPYRLAEMRALVCAPLYKSGRFVARMTVHQKTPRCWSNEEIKLIKIATNRCWESIARARAVRSLKESEERYRAFIAQSTEAIWRFELEQPIPVTLPEDEQIELVYKFAYLAECNDAMARMYGYDSAGQILGTRIGDLLVRSDPRNIAHLRAFRRAGYKLTDSESREIDRYGAIRYFLNNLTGIVENGVVVRAWGTQRDITEQRLAEKALRESEERYRLLIELSPDGVVIADGDDVIHLANPSVLRILNASPERVVGRSLFDFLPPECVSKYRDCLTDLTSRSLPEDRVEITFRRADGQRFPAEVSAVRFDWQGRPYAQIVIRDIAGRKQAEAERERLLGEIEAERNRLWQILEQMPIGVSIAEAPSGRPLFHNREAERLMRHLLLPSEDYMGYAQYGALHEDGNPYRAEEYPSARSLVSGEVIKSEEMRYRRGDGTETIFSVNSTPIYDPEGHMVMTVSTFIDIVARKQAEEALRESEERFAKAFRASPDSLVISRLPDGVILEANDSFVSLSGYKRDEVIGNNTIDLGLYVDPGDRQRTLAILKEQNYVRDFEFVMKRKSGEERLITFSAEPLELHGESCWLTIGRDITERKRAEEALRESEERFSKAFRASPDGLVISRLADGLILEVNDSFVSLSGYKRDEVIGKSTIDLGLYVDPGDRQRSLAILKEQNYVRDFEFVMKRKSGEGRLIAFSAEPLELHGESCWLTIVRDITERKRAEEALRKSEEQARRQLAQIEAIYATAPVGLCFMDTEQRYVNINKRLAEISGKSVEEYLGRTVREAAPEMAGVVEPILWRVAETGEPALNVELSIAADSNSGVVRHFIASYYPIKNGDERMLGVNVVIMEITQRKKIEEERERLLKREKTARAEAEATSRMKDEFLATISHELRTPLTSILGWARMLTSGSLSGPQERHAVDVIAQSAQSQARLIDDILDVARIITGRLKLDAQPVEIERVFQAAIDVIRPSAEAKGITLRAVIGVQAAVVLGDANRLQQAIWNLLSNAVKFTNEGGRIEARLTRVEGRIEISVTDTGIGIEPQFLPFVFDRFRQADSASTRKYSGLGLGLAIVRHIIEMHGGDVSASSAGKGQGATFKISLPLAAASRLAGRESRQPESEVKQAERRTPEEGQRLDGVRVLVVEDNPDTLEMLRFILDEAGAEVIAAESADEALEALERFRPDALVSDIAMPGKDGYDLIREVRSREPERGGKIPAVAVTAYARAEDRMRALASGFQMHVAKPVDPSELIAVVASLTGHIHF